MSDIFKALMDNEYKRARALLLRVQGLCDRRNKENPRFILMKIEDEVTAFLASTRK